MALKVNLLLNKTYFLPGEVVQVSVQMSNEPENAQQQLQALLIKELSFQACGTERTNPNFIQRLWRPDSPVDVADSQKQVRTIFSTEPAVLVSNQPLRAHAVKQYQLRFRLPTALPPSFRGSAVRFVYGIQVKAVYEVQKGAGEAIVYETTASTSLMVWPAQGGASGLDRRGTAAGASGTIPESSGGSGLAREFSRTSSQFSGSGSGLANGGWGGSFSAAAAAAAAGGSTGVGPSGGAGAGGPGAQPMSPTASSLPPTPSVGACGGGDDDVAMTEYGLGHNNCRIRWREVETETSISGMLPQQPQQQQQGASASGLGATSPLAVPPSRRSTTPLLHGSPRHAGSRGHIPFAINKPGADPYQQMKLQQQLQQQLQLLPDSEDENGLDEQPGVAKAYHRASSSQSSHLQRQISGGGAPAVGPYTRAPSRKGSLFGKQYALNVGEHPLLRLILQAPLEMPLQPGATFGGVLDFRPPAMAAGRPPVPVQCHYVLVLLESEEVLAADFRAASLGGASSSPHTVRKLHLEHHEMPTDVALTSFTFSVPASATPSFRTPMVALRWVLRFELMIGPRLDFASMDKRAKAPRVPLEQLVWNLPLVVRPPVAAQR